MLYPTVHRRRRLHRWWTLAVLALLGVVFLATWQSRPTSSSQEGTVDLAEWIESDPVIPVLAAFPDIQTQPVSGPDRFMATPPLAERWLGSPEATIRQRWRLVATGDDAIPLARVVDLVVRENGGWRLLEQEAMRPDAVMVAVPDGFAAGAVAAHLSAAGFRPIAGNSADAVVVVQLNESSLEAVPEALAHLCAALPVFTAEPDFLRFPAQATPDDYDPHVLWGLENIEAPAAWRVTSGSADVVVAVLDSGMEATHPDLAPNLWTNSGEIAGNGVDDDGNGFVDDVHGWDFSANSAAIIDQEGHGTHVSGTIGAAGNNGQGVTGVNWRVRLMPLRVGNSTFPDSALINALRYASALRSRSTHRANIVAANASLGGGGFNGTFRTEVENAAVAGILLVAAAGNDGTNNDASPTYPASYDLDSIISVAAIHQGSGRSRFSNFGATSVDLAAPGTGVFSTQRTGGYGYQNGTSMAAPHVTGALALVAAAEPALTMAQRRARILQTVDSVPVLAGVVATGGKLNLRRVVAPAVLRPLVAITAPAARVIAMDRAGLSVTLTAAVRPDNGSIASATLVWDAPEGPASVAFSSVAGSTTIATFPAPGRYRVRVRATAGPLTESDAVVVAVGSVQPDAAGLRARWNFDEAAGVALDASGDNRTGTLNGATRTSGVLGSALSLNGTTTNVGFAAPALSRVTIAGWARATGAGNSIFPRMVHMRSGLLFFGLDAGPAGDDGNAGTLKFALDDGSASPVWHTPPGTVGLNTWFHVAVSYDPTAPAPAPRFFINGLPQVFGTQASGGATPPTVAAGQGFIGDRGDATREWLGQLDEIRLYDRELSASEFALLGHEVTLQALVNATLARGAHSDPLVVPLVFGPAATGLAAPTFTHTAWSVVGGGAASFAPASGFGTTMHASGPGDYLVRFDGTTSDGVHIVRTLALAVVADPVATPGYYTGTTSDGGTFVLRVGEDGVGSFFGASAHGSHRFGFTVANWGGFSFTDHTGANIAGQIDASGAVSGTIGTESLFDGARLDGGFGAVDPLRDGSYAGWVLDSGIRAVAQVERGRVALVVQESGLHRAVEGVLGPAGAFALSPATNAMFTGASNGTTLTADITLPGHPPRRIVLLREGFTPARRLTNLSLRGGVGGGDAVLIPGFVVQGADPLSVLVRAIGPGLVDFNVSGFLAQPRLQLLQGFTLLRENAGWSGATNGADISIAAARVNAFSLDPSRADAAALETLTGDTYTVIVNGENGGAGVALAEVYDARTGGENARLVNLSGRGLVGTGGNILIGGFVLTGDAPALVLVRGVGPALAGFGVTGALSQPVLTMFRGPDAITSSTSWAAGESAVDIAAAAALSSAFPLALDSADAAQLLFLEPGNYTAQVSGANDTTGIALVEIYLVSDF